MSNMLADYAYQLPEELIADRPASRREDSRLLLLDRASQSITHHSFREFPDLMPAGSLAVLNNTKVIPARVFDHQRGVEALLMDPRDNLQWSRYFFGSHPVLQMLDGVFDFTGNGEDLREIGLARMLAEVGL